MRIAPQDLFQIDMQNTWDEVLIEAEFLKISFKGLKFEELCFLEKVENAAW